MSFGKLYGFAANPRTLVQQVVAKYEDLELELVETNPLAEDGVSAEYKAKFPLGLVPAFEKGDYKLTESVAIATNNKAGLLGSTKEDAASVQQWMNWANAHLLIQLAGWFAPLLGFRAYNKAAVDTAKTNVLAQAAYLEKTLASRTFLVGERISLADIFVAAMLVSGFRSVLDAEFRAAHPNILRHFNTVVHQTPFVAALGGEPTFVEKAVVYTPPKKEEKPKKEAAAPKPKAKKEDDDEEPSAPAEPKAKHPCEALGPASSFPLDEWKRQYSNNDTPVAMKWLDEHYNPNDYSIVKATFRYPEELTQVFMSSNLITGFHTRLEASRKYLFGSMGVYGKANDSLITGVYMIRGNDWKGVFDVAPDYESYEFTPLDYKTDREFIGQAWAWEGSVEGKEYADGKVFK
ncbi:hypothetical protein JCM1841_005071 [Sporobolomyces salmonicolor]